jgi:hypothetical protein
MDEVFGDENFLKKQGLNLANYSHRFVIILFGIARINLLSNIDPYLRSVTQKIQQPTNTIGILMVL